VDDLPKFRIGLDPGSSQHRGGVGSSRDQLARSVLAGYGASFEVLGVEVQRNPSKGKDFRLI
jgi:hypothetical protein